MDVQLQRNNRTTELCPQFFHKFGNIRHMAECTKYHHAIEQMHPKAGARLDGVCLVAQLIDLHSPAFLAVRLLEIRAHSEAGEHSNACKLQTFKEFEQTIQAYYSVQHRPLAKLNVGYRCILKVDGLGGAAYCRCIILDLL